MLSLKWFNFYAPLRIVFEKGSIKQIGQFTARNGSRVLLVTGRKHLRETGKLELILRSLRQSRKIEEVIVFDKTPQNPDVEAIHEARDIIMKNRLNVIVAVGGGSSMDLAKIASVCAKNKSNVMDLYSNPALPVMKGYPIICSPTTSGSGSEVSKFAVFNNNVKKYKLALGSEAFYPKVSLIDPELTYSMPKSVIANTGFDALSHSIEAYVSNSSCPITDAYCREALSLIHTYLAISYSKHDVDAMNNMSLAAMFAGMALNAGRACLPHAMEHALSAYRPELPHGLGLSMVILPFLKRSYKCNQAKFADIAYLLGEDIANKNLNSAAEMCIVAVEKIKDKLNLKQSLKDFGFDKKEIDDMVERTFFSMEHGIKNSPCEFDKKDIKEMYYEALEA